MGLYAILFNNPFAVTCGPRDIMPFHLFGRLADMNQWFHTSSPRTLGQPTLVTTDSPTLDRRVQSIGSGAGESIYLPLIPSALVYRVVMRS
ncbi:hypothetical protein SCLCIDRAFT_1209169 [Scleroderma citrinum Foug A]|uniref:Uncharacterized protein n=1 Tax=Scleroderma citrinum Foug A TaxID=1036808 RepID=A0A0C3A5I5_9AGAM|nr:hypothetical protein SCLCIDRAFT_1209169 [Scleroderma citrinum Foug A]